MKSCNTAPDSHQRDRILRETERNVLVQASAGTGKTTLMVDRVVQLVKEGIPLEEIAVVTFTNPAAAELRLRIRKKLREEKKTGCGECQRALSVISTAWISTIHGFASRLLREYFNLTGVDPDFTTTETHFSPMEMKRMWDNWLLSSGIPAEAGDLLSRTGSDRQKNIGMGIEGIRWLDSIHRVGSEEAVGKIFQDFVEEHGRELERTLETCSDRTDKLFVSGAQFIKGLKMIEEQLPNPDPELVEKLTGLLKTNCGSKTSWPDKDEVKEVYKQTRDEYGAIAQVLTSGGLTTDTWQVAGSFARVLRDKWDNDPSRLSYDDLLFKACSAVEGSSLLSELLAARFRHVLIDEFQDTSIDQTQLFRAFLEKDGKLPSGVIT
ncbi:MAG: AAA family ATPase, partial [Candidatus Aegiribacteria sp.]|nr:AAA family ATPase [Candidatus Aegiribacteria sp.]MBD3294809.1 AAA family ATPase [Candidatus Fermentibacteria bacterium]